MNSPGIAPATVLFDVEGPARCHLTVTEEEKDLQRGKLAESRNLLSHRGYSLFE